MSVSRRPKSEEVEQLLLNAELRDELEGLLDESIFRVNVEQLPTAAENEFLASMLAWERAPTVPISRWFDPELKLPDPDELDDITLRELLWQAINQLFEMRIVLDFTDHLSDRELYSLIRRDILPAREKKIDSSRHFLHWDCADVADDPLTWLRYYATHEDRESWAEETGEELPEALDPPYPRNLPRAPM